MHREQGHIGKLDIHPCLWREKTTCPTLSVPVKPSQRQGAGGLQCPSHAGGAEGASGRKAAEALAGGQVPLLAGDKRGGGVALSRRAEGSGQPSLSGVGCHRHINQPAELPSALTQRGSILPNRNQGQGGQGQGDFSSCALLARIAAGVSWAAWPVNPMESLQQPKLGGGKRLIPLKLMSLQDTTPRCPGSLNPVWTPSGLSRKRKNYSR